MDVDPPNNEYSPDSSLSYDSLPELMEPLKRVVFECFAANKNSVQFIASYNHLMELELLSSTHKAEATIQALLEIGCAKNDCHPLLLEYLDTLWECRVGLSRGRICKSCVCKIFF